MKFPSLFKQQFHDSGRILLVDVGDVFLKFAFCEKDGQRFRVVLWGSEELNIIFWRRPLETIWKVIEQSYIPWTKDQNIPKGTMVLSFTPSIFKAKIKEFVFPRKDSFEKISQQEEEAMNQEIQETLKTQVTAELVATSGIQKEEFLLRDSNMVKITIDGYDVPALRGFAGAEIRCLVLGTFLLRTYSEMLESIVREHHLQTPVLLHQVQIIQEFARATNRNGTFVDIGDALTQILGVKDGKLVFLKELDTGAGEFTDLLIRTLGMNEDSAREFKEKYSQGKLSEDVRGKLRAIFLPEAAKMGKMIEESIESHPLLFGEPIYLFGGGAGLPELQEVLKGHGYLSEILVPQDVKDIFNWNHSLNTQYTPLILQLHAISN